MPNWYIYINEEVHVLITHIKDNFVGKRTQKFWQKKREKKNEEKEKVCIHKYTHANRRNIKNICSGSTLHTRQHYRWVVCVSLCSRAYSRHLIVWCIYLCSHRHFFNSMSSLKKERQKKVCVPSQQHPTIEREKYWFSFLLSLSLSLSNFFNNFNHLFFLFVFTYKLFEEYKTYTYLLFHIQILSAKKSKSCLPYFFSFDPISRLVSTKIQSNG